MHRVLLQLQVRVLVQVLVVNPRINDYFVMKNTLSRVFFILCHFFVILKRSEESTP